LGFTPVSSRNAGEPRQRQYELRVSHFEVGMEWEWRGLYCN